MNLDTQPTIRHAVSGTRRLAGSFWQTGRRSLVLGGLLLLAASTASVVATANSAPNFTSLTVNKSVLNEGETVTLTGSFSDPDPNQRHTLTIYWYSARTEELQRLKQKVQLPAGQSTFQVSHTYTDNFPAAPIQVNLRDHDLPDGANDNTGGLAGDVELVPITVKNVAPRIADPVSVSSSRVSATKVRVDIDGAIADATRDTHQVRAARWYGSKPANVTTPCTATNLRFHCELIFTSFEADSNQAVSIYVKDDDGAEGSKNITVDLEGGSSS